MAYVAGLGATVAVMFYFKAAQPALFYLVPACLGATGVTALWRKGACLVSGGRRYAGGVLLVFCLFYRSWRSVLVCVMKCTQQHHRCLLSFLLGRNVLTAFVPVAIMASLLVSGK